jgi:cytochrome c oxidase cbb3-type subunit 3/ubiquinol-cytochrome c reductase cytochrome c subunit
VLPGLVVLAGCHLPGRPKPGDEVPRPEAVLSFDKLYAQNCAGCHGVDGQNGPATNLANPIYEALVDDATLRDVIANGEKGTLMPGFGQSAGGSLTDAQVNAIVSGMRAKWAKANVLQGQNAPPYKASAGGGAAHDLAHGQQVYATACARCHGATAQQPGPAGSILDGAFLGLIDAQTIRTTVIAGRPDIGQPDWRGDVPGHPLRDADVSDVTAWLLAQRPANPGQPYPDNRTTTEKPGEAQPIAPVSPQRASSPRTPAKH